MAAEFVASERGAIGGRSGGASRRCDRSRCIGARAHPRATAAKRNAAQGYSTGDEAENFHEARQTPRGWARKRRSERAYKPWRKRWYGATLMGQPRGGRDRATSLELESRAKQRMWYFLLLLVLCTSPQKEARPNKLCDKAVPHHDGRCPIQYRNGGSERHKMHQKKQPSTPCDTHFQRKRRCSAAAQQCHQTRFLPFSHTLRRRVSTARGVQRYRTNRDRRCCNCALFPPGCLVWFYDASSKQERVVPSPAQPWYSGARLPCPP